MKYFFLFIIAFAITSCNTKSSLNLTIVETGSDIPVVDAKVDIIQVSFGGSLGNPSTSSELIESIFSDENGEICFTTREAFDKIEIEVSKENYFDIIPDNNPRYDFFDLNEGEQAEITFEMDPQSLLEFRIIDDPVIQEAGIVLRPGFPGTFEKAFSMDTVFVGIVPGNQFHDFGFKYFNTLGFTRDSLYIDKDQTNFINLLF